MRNVLLPALCALAIGVAGISAPQADAKPAMHRGQHMAAGPDRQMENLFQQLNLTDAQKDQIKAIRQKHMDAVKPVRDTLRTKHQELFTLIKKPGTTKDQALAKQREINGLQNQLAESRINSWFEARAVLTPDQLKQLETVQPRRMGRGQGQGGRQGQ